MGVMLLTASGRNRDIIRAFENAAGLEPKALVAICAQAASPLADSAARWPSSKLFSFALSTGKDGFLATNSLLATTILLSRAYAKVAGQRLIWPRNFGSVQLTDATTPRTIRTLQEQCSALWTRSNFIVLYGPDTHPGATDIESKFTEAALGTVQLADFRNFAHGRHHWLAKHPTDSAVIALATSDDYRIASRTVELLPPDTPKVLLNVPHSGPQASLASVTLALYLTAFLGDRRGIDPGRPGVPRFGRLLYHMGERRVRSTPVTRSSPHSIEAAAICRKAGIQSIETLRPSNLAYWRAAYSGFRSSLAAAAFGGVVFDYDGTLCGPAERGTGPRQAVCNELVRLADAGVLIGVATGRGGSAGESLRDALPERVWQRIWIGYYNGATIASLSDTSAPTVTRPRGAMRDVARILAGDKRVRALLPTVQTGFRSRLGQRTWGITSTLHR